MIKTFIKKEPVLLVSALLAVISMFFVPPSSNYFKYIDCKTLSCLLCLMISLKGFEREGILNIASAHMSAKISNARVLAFFLVFSCFFAAMFMTNDVALIALVPMTLMILSMCSLEKISAFIIVLETIAANIGSSLTPIGNPQNLYLFTHFEMQLSEFLITTGEFVIVGGVILALSCLLVPKMPLKLNNNQPNKTLRPKFILIYSGMFVLSVLAVFGAISYWVVLFIISVCSLLADYKTIAKVDYSLLITFAVIFIFVGNISNIDVINNFLVDVTKESAVLTAVISSQIISNVPAAILLSGFTANAKALLIGVNIGGMGTLIASMASVISYKLYANANKGGTFRYMMIFTACNTVFLFILGAAVFI